jgi:nitrogenase-stabilizing/protective protein
MPCETDSFEDDLADLSSAEEFLEYFDIDFDVRVVQVNRLHILQRFHDYLAKQEAGKAPDYDAYRQWLARAYTDFVDSSAQPRRSSPCSRKPKARPSCPCPR